MKTNGKVNKLLANSIAEVVCEPNEACEKCKGCAMGGSGEIIVQAVNQIEAKIGGRVEIEIPEAEGIKAALIVFIFPVIGLVFGYYLAQHFYQTESAGIIGAIGFMAVAFLILNKYDKYIKSKNKCVAKIIRKYD